MISSLSRSPHECPRCHVALLLSKTPKSTLTMHGCPSCGGVWLNPDCAKRFSSALPHDALALASKYAKNAASEVDTAPSVQCPVCKWTMKRTHIAAAQLEVDGCNAHGVWYDRNELQSIAKAMAKLNWLTPSSNAAAIAATATTVVASSALTNPSVSKAGGDIADHVETAVDVIDAGLEVADVVDVVDVASGAGEIISGFFDFISSVVSD